MTSFLVVAGQQVSEWKNTFDQVQECMNALEKQGKVTGVEVSKFVNNVLVGRLVYDYNGVNWERR